MPRYFQDISIEDFKQKIFKAIVEHEDFSPYRKTDKIENWNDLYHQYTSSGKPSLYHNHARLLPFLTRTVSKDMKVSFDTENISIDSPGLRCVDAPPHGFFTLPNGMTMLGASAGGDWEVPVYFILYWDGKSIRGYVPENGNQWNTTTKQAYGNDPEEDAKNVKLLSPQLDFIKDELTIDEIEWQFIGTEIIQDIQERITKKDNSVVENHLQIECNVCHEELTEPGALIFGPPDRNDMVKKYHICVKCWKSKNLIK